MNPLAWWAIGAATYMILGLATAVAWELEYALQSRDDAILLYIIALIWPVVAPYLLIVGVARKISRRHLR